VDDYPFGGGAAWSCRAAPFDSIDAVRGAMPEGTQVVCLSPGGSLFTNRMARELAALPGLLLLCGHYEGIDQRVIDCRVDREISIGDYVLTGGELAALVVADAVMRFLPGVVGNQDVHAEESFEQGLLEYPQYTRPADFRGLPVPEVLLGGHHARIAAWRREQSLLKTARVRPDLIEKAALTEEEKERIGGNSHNRRQIELAYNKRFRKWSAGYFLPGICLHLRHYIHRGTDNKRSIIAYSAFGHPHYE
jgi:tRNA (guanine37-N1)-methyltransferase